VGAGAGGYSAVDLAADEVATFAAAASGPWADTLAPSAGDPLRGRPEGGEAVGGRR
jgi:hypothetical protein